MLDVWKALIVLSVTQQELSLLKTEAPHPLPLNTLASLKSVSPAQGEREWGSFHLLLSHAAFPTDTLFSPPRTPSL